MYYKGVEYEKVAIINYECTGCNFENDVSPDTLDYVCGRCCSGRYIFKKKEVIVKEPLLFHYGSEGEYL